jgi:hypothetical protein
MSSDDDRAAILAADGHPGLDLQPALHAIGQHETPRDLTPGLYPTHVEHVRPRRFAVHCALERELRFEDVWKGARRTGRHVRAWREDERARLPGRRSFDRSGEDQLTFDLKQAIAPTTNAAASAASSRTPRRRLTASAIVRRRGARSK